MSFSNRIIKIQKKKKERNNHIDNFQGHRVVICVIKSEDLIISTPHTGAVKTIDQNIDVNIKMSR